MIRCPVGPGEWEREEIALSPGEAHHLRDVLRVKAGESVELFDGEGRVASAEIVSAGHAGMTARVLDRRETPPPAVRVVLLQAVIKGARMDWVFQKAAELGAWRVIPVVSDRCVVRIRAGEDRGRVERWTEIVMGASAQCGNNWPPRVSAPARLEEGLREAAAARPLLHCSLRPSTVPIGEALAAAEWPDRGGELGVVVGPEGDFSPAEEHAIERAGATPVGLGPLILRAETAAFYALSVLAYERDRRGLR